MLKMVHHVQKIRIFTSKLHLARQYHFVSKAHMKQQFLKGLISASIHNAHSYAQVVSQGVKKNAVGYKDNYGDAGITNKSKKNSKYWHTCWCT